jgi:hypothetical protein
MNREEDVVIRIKYQIDTKDLITEDPFKVRWCNQKQAILLESSSLFSDHMLYWGDEVTLKPYGDQYELASVKSPSEMLHFESACPPPPDSFTEALNAIGGNWECDAGYFFVLHVPAKHCSVFFSQYNLNHSEWEQVFSGHNPFEDMDIDDFCINDSSEFSSN